MIDVVAFPGRWLPRVALLAAHATALVLALLSSHRAAETSAPPPPEQVRVVRASSLCARDYCGPPPGYAYACATDYCPPGAVHLIKLAPAPLTKGAP